MLVREWQAADIGEVARIEKASFSDPWNTDMILSSFNLPRFTGLVAKEKNAVAGYIGSTYIFEDAEILLVAVDEKYRRKGVATSLFASLFDILKAKGVQRVFLEVRKKNSAARALYTSLGFIATGERTAYYGDDDAIIMEKSL